MDIKELFREGLDELGYIPEPGLISHFMTYLIELKKWSRVYNLTGLKKDEDIVIKHFFDSLLYLKAIPSGEIKVADVGSGAGFPGIPLKIIRPEIKMYLIEPSRKKSAFLRHMVRTLSLKKIEVIEKRIEDVGRDQETPLSVDAAVTRALFSIKDFVKKVSQIVKEGGILILSKGPTVKEELKDLKNITYEILNIRLPLSNITRNIVKVSL
ncbi:MAG: 16S rRNA (guanine(527)-N(7))-methyltransferase RsmG [Nitrospirota bacterium]